jgi:hypothetical protein
VGTPSNPAAVVYVFVPADGTDMFYFLQNGNEMELLNEELNPYTGEGCYTLLLVE